MHLLSTIVDIIMYMYNYKKKTFRSFGMFLYEQMTTRTHKMADLAPPLYFASHVTTTTMGNTAYSMWDQ